jgi:hypothetical protein
VVHFTIVPNGQREQIDDKDGKRPATGKIDEHERETEEGISFVEYVHEGKIHHDNAHNEKNHPRLAKLQAMYDPETDAAHHSAILA